MDETIRKAQQKSASGGKEALMNGRYSPARSMKSGGYRRGPRIQTILILLLMVMLAVSLVLGIPAMRFRGEAEEYFAGRMLTECDAAVSQLPKLSRTASVSSYSVLSDIRSRVYAAQILNESCMAIGGKPVINDASFSAVYTTIQEYTDNLNVGAMTANLQSELTETLGDLRDQIAQARQ